MQTDIADATPPHTPRVDATAANAPPKTGLRGQAVSLGLILGLAFVLRLAWAVATDWQPVPDDDAFRYDFAARALARATRRPTVDGPGRHRSAGRLHLARRCSVAASLQMGARAVALAVGSTELAAANLSLAAVRKGVAPTR